MGSDCVELLTLVVVLRVLGGGLHCFWSVGEVMEIESYHLLLVDDPCHW
jgi:hypothetical protein